MAANDELFRILLEVVGEEGINELKNALAATKAQAAELGEQYRRGEITQQDYLKGSEALAREAANYQKTVVGLERALDAQAKATANAGAAVLSLKNRLTEEEEAAERAGKGSAAAMGKIGAGGTDAAYKLQVLGGTLDDLQYVGEQGLRPILGNIMQISPAVGIALLAFDLMRKALGAFVGEAAEAGSEVERLRKRVEELEKAPHKIQLDIDNLNAAEAKLSAMEKRLAAFESARETTQAADLAKQADDVVTNYGGADAFMKSVLEMEKVAGVSHGEGADEVALRDKQTALASLLARTGGDANMSRSQRWAADALRKGIDELQAKIEQANQDWAKQEVGAFASGDEAAIQRMQNRAARNPGAFSTVGSRGIDAAEAIGNLPPTRREAQMRAEKDAADRKMEGLLKEQRAKREADRESTIDAEEAGIRGTIEAKDRRERQAESTLDAEEAGIAGTIEAKDRKAKVAAEDAEHDRANAVVPNLPARQNAVTGALADEMNRRAQSPAWRAARRKAAPKPAGPAPGAENLDVPAGGPDQQGGINPDAGGKAIDLTAQLLDVAGQAVAQVSSLTGRLEAMGRQVADLKRQSSMNNGRIRGMNPTNPGSWNPLPFAGLS